MLVMKEIRDFIQMVEKKYPGWAGGPMGEPEYKALKGVAARECTGCGADTTKLGSCVAGCEEYKNGWIPHDGTGQPVDDVVVEVKFREDVECKHYEAGGEACTLGWEWEPDPADIIAYRIVEEPKKKYKLSEMWKVWHKEDCKDGDQAIYNILYSSRELAISEAKEMYRPDLLAITPANATEFYEGEGLDGS